MLSVCRSLRRVAGVDRQDALNAYLCQMLVAQDKPIEVAKIRGKLFKLSSIFLGKVSPLAQACYVRELGDVGHFRLSLSAPGSPLRPAPRSRAKAP